MTRSFSVVLLALLAATALHAQTFEVLGSLTLPPADYPQGTSADGTITAGSQYPPSNGTLNHAVRWDGIVPQQLATLAGFTSSTAYAVSAAGSVIVGESRNATPSSAEAVLWDNGVVRGLGRYNGLNSFARGVSGDGRVVVGYVSVSTVLGSAFRWESGTMTLLPTLPGGSADAAYGASGNGNVIVGESNGRAVRWVGGAVEDLGCITANPASTCRSRSYAVTSSGAVIVGQSNSTTGFQPTRWEGGVMRGLGCPFPSSAGCNGQARSVSNDGQTVIGDAIAYGQNTGATVRAFIWTAGRGMRDLKTALEADYGLNLTGIWLTNAYSVSGNGRVVVGIGYGPTGNTFAWRVTLGPPEEPEDIVVTMTSDEENDATSASDDHCDIDLDMADDQCTLRAAIELANDRGGATITFDIPGGGVPRIDVPAETEDDKLPPFTSAITLDGTTQPGGWVELVGPGQNRDTDPLIAGIDVGPGGGGSEIRGLVVHGFRDAGIILRQGADGCLVEGNRIGTDATGMQWRGNGDRFGGSNDGPLPPGVFGAGVEVYSAGNVIRGNVLAGNVRVTDGTGGDGSALEGGLDLFFGPTAADNRVEGNRIGVGADGAVVAVPPLDTDIYGYLGIGAVGGGTLTVGGDVSGVPATCTGTCNLVAGHQTDLYLAGWASRGGYTWPGPAGAVVTGNHVGIDATGTLVVPSDPDYTGIAVGAEATPARVAYNRVGVSGRGSGRGIDASPGDEIIGNSVFGDPDSAVGGLSVNFVGIRASGAGGVVRGNIVSGTVRYGIAAFGIDLLVEGNEVTDNPVAGLWVGGGARVTGNVVHDNGAGVLVDERSSARIGVNEIYDNRIGIDLAPTTWEGGDGVTPNDYGDGDEGGNGLQNFPNVLQTVFTDGRLTITGFVSTPLLSSATYAVDAYLSHGCRSEARYGGMVFGQGEHFFYGYQTTSNLGDADIDIDEGNVPAGYTHVSLLTTREDTGETSEFSRCIPLVGADQTASANVGPGQSGSVLDDRGVTVSIPVLRPAGAARAAAHDGGALYLTRYQALPTTSVFAGSTAPGTGGTAVMPDAVAARYWLLADRGLTAAGGAPDGSGATFSVCLDPTGVVLPGGLGSVVVVRRDEATGGGWVPYPTTSTPHGSGSYLCADGVTSLGEFGIGGAASAFPVAGEEDGPASAALPVALSVSVYPNPVRGAATVEVAVPAAQRVSVAVYDLLGRRVAVLHEDTMAAGTHALRWDAGALPGGVYLVRVVGETAVQTQMITVVR